MITILCTGETLSSFSSPVTSPQAQPYFLPRNLKGGQTSSAMFTPGHFASSTGHAAASERNQALRGCRGCGEQPTLRLVSRTARGHGAVQGPVSAGRAGPLPGRVCTPQSTHLARNPGGQWLCAGWWEAPSREGRDAPMRAPQLHAARGKSSCGQAPSAATAVGLLRGAVRAEKVSAAPWDESYQTI